MRRERSWGVVTVFACLMLASATPGLSSVKSGPTQGHARVPRVDGVFSWWVTPNPTDRDIHMHAEGDSVIAVTSPGILEARCHHQRRGMAGLARSISPDSISTGDRTGLLSSMRWKGPYQVLATWTEPVKGNVVSEEAWFYAGDWHTAEVGMGDRTPEPGQYVVVEKQPQPITRVAPRYPDEARESGVDGLVMVLALVGSDGLVKETSLAVSIPGLDEAALACVRQWKYQPALANGVPVTVWVPAPVRFSLH